MRTFGNGAIRDTEEGKLSYIKGLSPIVQRSYLQYLDKHRHLPNGDVREFDNWKQGIPLDVYLDSLGRHFFDVWLMMQGFEATDNHGKCNIIDTLHAIRFNTDGLLHEMLKDKVNKYEENKND